MASLIDVFGRLLLEDGGRKFVADAAKAGEAAGGATSQTMGQRLTAGLKTSLGVGAKLLATGASAAFGIATKGALEMENATARYRAETGATAEEAKAALSAVNAIAGRQRQSLEAVTDVAVKVRRDLGAVGDQAATLTEQFVLFARVTRQDAAAAVSDFDDILDSWGLKATDAQSVMDKLLVSQQRFGGDITQTAKSLAQLAAPMRAANFTIDDGISLLGLFGSKGLDAQQGAAAFAKALTKVKSPAELQKLIDDISATEDPFKRAQKAADLFGAKAGAKLANALGGVDLKDYAISMDDAAGATQRAGDALDSTFSAQVQKKISEAGAALRAFGQDMGPAVTGLASLASLGGSLGLDKLLAKGFGKLAGSALVKGAAGKAGAAIGLIFSGAMFAAEQLQGLLSSAFSALPGSSKVMGALKGAGGALGGSLGAFAAVGLAAALWVAVFDTYNKIKDGLAQQNAAISSAVGDQVATGTTEALQQSKAALEQGLKDINGVWDAGIFTTDSRKKLEADLASVNAELARRAQQLPESAAAGVQAGTPALTQAIGEMYGPPAPPPGVLQTAQATGEAIPETVAQGIRKKRDAISSAMSDLTDLLKNAMSPATEVARLTGQLTSTELAKGLRSKDPVVREAAQNAEKLILDRLSDLAAQGVPFGKKAAQALRDGLKSKDPVVRAQAQRIKSIVEGKFSSIDGKGAGQSADQGLAKGLAHKAGTVGAAARTVGGTIANNIIAGVAAQTKIPLWKFGGIRALGTGGHLDAGEPAIVGERGKPELWIPDVPGTVVPTTAGTAAAAVPVGQQLTVNVEVRPGSDTSLANARRFGQAVADEVANALRTQTARSVPGGAGA